jgi:hypothetical protein
MLEKLMQAALITFLLHLIAGLSPHTQSSANVVTSVPEQPAPILSSLFKVLE